MTSPGQTNRRRDNSLIQDRPSQLRHVWECPRRAVFQKPTNLPRAPWRLYHSDKTNHGYGEPPAVSLQISPSIPLLAADLWIILQVRGILVRSETHSSPRCRRGSGRAICETRRQMWTLESFQNDTHAGKVLDSRQPSAVSSPTPRRRAPEHQPKLHVTPHRQRHNPRHH